MRRAAFIEILLPCGLRTNIPERPRVALLASEWPLEEKEHQKLPSPEARPLKRVALAIRADHAASDQSRQQLLLK